MTRVNDLDAPKYPKYLIPTCDSGPFSRQYFWYSWTSGKEAKKDEEERLSEEQIAFALREAETATPVKEVLREPGISEQTFYRWERKYGCLDVSEVRKLKQLAQARRWAAEAFGGGRPGPGRWSAWIAR